MKQLLSLAAVAALLLVAAPSNFAQDKDKALCPVSGKPIVETSFRTHNGGKVFFCCDNCPKAFDGDKAKFATKANHQLLVTKQAKQTLCPFTGMEINNDATVEVKGAKVAFCCQMCQGKAMNLPEAAQISTIFGDVTFKKSFQVKSK